MQLSKHIDSISALVGTIVMWLGLCGDTIFGITNPTQAIIASTGLMIIFIGAFYPLYLKYKEEKQKTQKGKACENHG